MGQAFPILFTFKEVIVGNGFLGLITATGRALLVKEGEDDFWMYGITPGGIAANGSERSEALCEFRERFKSVLFDIAEEAKTSDVFTSAIEDFFYPTCESLVAEWEAARTEVHAGEKQLGRMKIVNADEFPTKVEIEIAVAPESTANPDEAVFSYAEAA